ncbi:MAG TPA: hypothetical protein VF779_05145 [Pyrinomonadaceae bacterium]
MAIEQINLSSIKQRDISSARILGTIGMLASPMLLIEWLLFTYIYRGENQNGRIVGLLGIIYTIGWACSLIGIRRLKALSRNLAGDILFVVQLAGVSLAFTQSVMELTQLNIASQNLLFQITDAAWPLSHLFMIIVGIYVLASRIWQGWRSVTPLLCGLALPLFFALAALGARGIGSFVFGAATTIAFMLLGNAVRTSDERS